MVAKKFDIGFIKRKNMHNYIASCACGTEWAKEKHLTEAYY